MPYKKLVNKKRVVASALAATFVFSAQGFAQAPVSDLSQANTSTTGALAIAPPSSLEDRVSVLERIVQSRTQTQHRTQEQLDLLQSELDELRGTLDLHTNQLEKILQRQRELYLEIDKRIESVKQNAGNTVVSGSSGISSTASNQVTNLSESEAYDKAVNLILKTREYDKAIPAFERFLTQFPNSDLADNAHYWLGQLLFNQQRWEPAKEAFSTVFEKFEQSDKRADAMLKLGVIAERNGKQSEAQKWFSQLIEQYPNSSAAKLASNKQN